ncbi:hypothetical protein HU200_033295 [Digitaria exilis]|uniref:Protein kinase domain-containing protein n=1 Tax=Digitaria exilis TaxID=1010633 RepID=A0A835BM07_9POAL|nr:hypothetical protein HU200_033295 [Digitaria exilis]
MALASPSQLPVAGQAPPVGLQANCTTICGDVIVPYPFGITAGCYLPSYNLTCDTRHTPPRLFLGNGVLQVVGISLENSTVRVVGPNIPMDPYTANGTWGGHGWGLSDDGPYFLSEEYNELVLVGCQLSAELSVILDWDYQVINTCGSFCGEGINFNKECQAPAKKQSRRCQRCSGIGCCQVPVSIGRSSYKVRLQSLMTPGAVNMPNSVFISEEGWFQEPYDHSNMTSSGIPAILAWVIVSEVILMSASFTIYAMALAQICLESIYANVWKEAAGIHVFLMGTVLGFPLLLLAFLLKNDYCLILALGTGIGAALIFLVLGTTFLIRKFKERRKTILRERFFKQNRGQLLQQLICHRTDIGERMIITLEELEKATNNFDKSRKLGGGGHGIVYKGILSSLDVVAIKKSKIVIQREINDFINEVAILSQMNHRNIVKLLGCCLETEVPLLVYEFISNGTLHSHLHVEASISICWKDRLRIAVETARAIAYLHSFASTPVIHRDIKSPNILLDDNLTVKLSDFGASRYVPIDKTGVDTAVQGTYGYLDPMYYSTRHLTEKSNVYSFGVVLIELLTRKKPVSYRSLEGYDLVNHFGTLLSEGKLADILDPQVSREGGGEVIDIALLAVICVKFVSSERPTMRHVEMALEGLRGNLIRPGYLIKAFSSLSREAIDLAVLPARTGLP